MDVFLDTNAVLGSGIHSVAFEALRTYLQRTRSRLLIPSVALEELCAQRRMLLQKLQRDLENVYRDLRRFFPETSATPPPLDSTAALAAYREEILESAESLEVILNVSTDLDELVRRLTGRIPPASPNGEEARDVLIWLALLRIAREGRVAFISGDRRAFFGAEGLRPELLSDLSPFESNVEAFNGLDSFLHAHHARSSFIDTNWIQEQIETKQVSQAVENFIDERPDFFNWWIERKGTPTGYVSLVQLVQYKIEDYFVSDAAPNELYVGVEFWAELEVEVEYDPENGYPYFRDERPATVCRCIYPCVRMQLQLKVVGEDLEAASVSTMESA